jgi:hypothetical protein
MFPVLSKADWFPELLLFGLFGFRFPHLFAMIDFPAGQELFGILCAHSGKQTHQKADRFSIYISRTIRGLEIIQYNYFISTM